MSILWEVGLSDFLLVTIFLGGGAAFLTGRAVALTWRPLPHLFLFVLLLACAVRFIHFALFHGTLLSLQFYLVDLVFLIALASLGYRLTRTTQMVDSYSWLYERTSRLSWRARRAQAAGPAD
jgi:hypothetical protein